MKKVIEAIRGVMGVSGVVLWEREVNVFHKLLPARLSASDVEAICNKIIALSQSAGKLREVKARFKQGWIWIHTGPSFTLLVLAKTDLNTTTLNLVMKSSLSTLESQIKRPSTTPQQQAPPQVEFTPEHISAIARAINLSLGHFQGEVSRFEIAEVLRQAKMQIIEQHPVLKHFSVDANGGIIVIKGAEKHMEADAVPAAAQLIANFVRLIDAKTPTLGFDIEKLTLGMHQLLSEIGFYNYFASARRMVPKER